ncbi:MAG: hypothetical protein ACLQNE_27975 [Thermoguttaceae bacterium]
MKSAYEGPNDRHPRCKQFLAHPRLPGLAGSLAQTDPDPSLKASEAARIVVKQLALLVHQGLLPIVGQADRRLPSLRSEPVIDGPIVPAIGDSLGR